MNACRVAGFVSLGLVLLMAGLLGAPPAMLAMIGGISLATAFLPRGVGAAALHNLAQKRYDRDRWQAHWSEGYLDGPADVRGARESSPGLPPGLLPADERESRAWLRTLATIRDLPERDPTGRPARPGRTLRPGRRRGSRSE